MSRASAARNQRRFQKKASKRKIKQMTANNKCWDELAVLEGGIVGLLFSTKNIIPVIQNEALMAKMDAVQVGKIASIINSDMLQFKATLEQIQSKHRDRTGGSYNQDEIMEAISIGQEYISLSEQFTVIVSPNVDRILEMAAAAAVELDRENGVGVEPVIEIVDAEIVEVETTPIRGMNKSMAHIDEAAFIEVPSEAPHV